MSYVHPAWLEAQRKRFTRADAYRLAPPGSPEAKPPGWLDPSATRVRLKEAQEDEARARAAAEQEAADAVFAAKRRALQTSQDELWRMLAEVKYELAWRRLVRKYSPDQPRDDRGRWTDSGAGARGGANDGSHDDNATPQEGDALAQDRGLPRTAASDQPPRNDLPQLQAIANDPVIRAHIDAAWTASNPYGLFPKEHGFWISRDDVSGQLFTRPFANRGDLDTIVPGSPPPDAIASFHTHPYGGIQLGAALPSREDETFAARVGLPGLIQSHVGVYYFGPPLRPAR
jgi:hypothetical protein